MLIKLSFQLHFSKKNCKRAIQKLSLQIRIINKLSADLPLQSPIEYRICTINKNFTVMLMQRRLATMKDRETENITTAIAGKLFLLFFYITTHYLNTRSV